MNSEKLLFRGTPVPYDEVVAPRLCGCHTAPWIHQHPRPGARSTWGPASAHCASVTPLLKVIGPGFLKRAGRSSPSGTCPAVRR